ncbi:MAG: hypothetical protein PHS82_13325, partial [Lachnospiraceae bacterium]|nr:hypothetical protein [Lachnospiraceae bacterium]
KYDMSRDTEKVFKEVHKYLDQNTNENMSMDEMNELIQNFMEQYNGNLPGEVTEKTAETSDDFYELAENAETKAQALKFAKKALLLDPDNIDAKVMVTEITTEHPYEMVGKYQALIAYAKEVMDRKGYLNEETIGDYWGITETRPFIRLYSNYLNLLIECGMMRQAARIGEEIIKYNEGDNLGIRFMLMHIYAYLEDEKGMLELHHKYDKHEETQMLLPISIAYFKMAEFGKAEEYLRRLAKVNKDTGRFMRAFLNDTLDKYISRMNAMGYRPFSIEELLVELHENSYLFETAPCYFDWAVQMLKKK